MHGVVVVVTCLHPHTDAMSIGLHTLITNLGLTKVMLSVSNTPEGGREVGFSHIYVN